MKAFSLWAPVVALFALILSTLPLGPTFGLWLERIGASPVVGEVALPEDGVVVRTSGGVTAVVMNSGALFVHTEAGSTTAPVSCEGIDVASGEVLCAAGADGLIRVSQQGEVLSRTPIHGDAVQAERVGRAVAVATRDGAIQVVTIDEDTVALAGRLDGVGSELVDLFAVDGAVVVADADGDLVGISLSNPDAPVNVGTSHVASRVHAVTGYGNEGFVAGGDDGVLLVDLADLGNIPVVGAHPIGTVTDVQISNGNLLWAMVPGEGAHAIVNTRLGPQFLQSPHGVEAELVAIHGGPPRQPGLIGDRLVFVDTRPSHDDLIVGVGVLALFGLLAVVAAVVRRGGDAWLGKLGWIALGAVALGWLLADRHGRPIEALHILEYGGLGALLVRAVRPVGGGLSGIVLAVIIATCAALVDETVQFLLPMRSGDLDDVWLDLQAAAVGAVVGVQLWVADKRASWAWPSFVAAGLVFAVVLFQHVTVGFGHRHHEGTLSLYSRLELDELRHIDATRGPANAALLERTAAMGYGIFLSSFPARSEPFLYELRVHLFRRDRRLEKGDLEVACGEERLLQTYFAQSYAGTSWEWPASMGPRCAPFADVPYDSPVSEEIITGSGPLRLWGGGLLGVVFLIGMGVRFRQRGQ